MKKIKKKPTTKVLKKNKEKHSSKKENIFDGVHKTKIRVIGVGGGGGSIISEIASRVKKADFVAANTDFKALEMIKGAKRFQFGKNITYGLGTGMNVEIGEKAAQSEKEKIEKLFKGYDVCIIISSLGGGTGCGATPIFAKIAKNLNCLTYGIFTLPFEFEGEKKMEIAKEALQKIKPYLNIYSVVPNERIFQIIEKNTPLKSALSAINEQLAKNIEGLIEMIYSPGLINIDFADLKTILNGQGKLAYLKTVSIKKIEGDNTPEKLISSKLYPYTIQKARGILYNIVGGNNLQLSDVSLISKVISESLNKNAKIIFGVNQRPRKQDKINLTILAVGCNIKGDIIKPINKKKSVAKKRNKKKELLTKPLTKIIPEKEENSTLFNGNSKGQKEDIIPSSKKNLESKDIFLNLKNGQINERTKENKINKKGNLNISDNVEKKQNADFMKAGQEKNSLSPVEKKIKQKIKLPNNVKFLKSGKKFNQSIKTEKKESKTDNLKTVNKNKAKRIKEYRISASEKTRRNALQVKKMTEEEENELLKQEKEWETPAIFRRKKKHNII